jgi:hypothetical protein
MFITFSPGAGLYYKTLRIRNLQENDKVHSKLLYSGSDKHSSMGKQTHLLSTESVNYKSVMFYSTGPINFLLNTIK